MNVECRNRLRIYDSKDETGHKFAIVSSTVERNCSYVRIIFDSYEVKKEFSDYCKISFFMNKEIVAVVTIECRYVYENYEEYLKKIQNL